MIISLPSDNFQKDAANRNNVLGMALIQGGEWNNEKIQRIWREPKLKEHPQPADPSRGQWLAEIFPLAGAAGDQDSSDNP